MSQCINDISVSVNDQEENQMLLQGYTAINHNLNKGTQGNKIYLWYKKGDANPITRIQFSFKDEMKAILEDGEYQEIDQNLNMGTTGNTIKLWYYKGMGKTSYDVPIKALDVSDNPEDEAKMIKFGWEKLACNLNRGNDGDKMYLWVKREKPTQICDITVSAVKDEKAVLINDGYMRVDECTNDNTFIWFRQTPGKDRAITDLKVSTNDQEYDEYLKAGYTKVKNEIERKAIWYIKNDKPIKTITLVTNESAMYAYKEGGVKVIEKTLSPQTMVYLCFYK